MSLICFWVPLGEGCHEQRNDIHVWCSPFDYSLHSYFDWLNLPSYDRGMMRHQWAARPDPSHPASRSRIPSDAQLEYEPNLCRWYVPLRTVGHCAKSLKVIALLRGKSGLSKKIRTVARLEIQITNRLLDWRYLNLWGFYSSWFILADWGMGQNPCNVVNHSGTKSPHGPMDPESIANCHVYIPNRETKNIANHR